jgi:hypothetical protein
VGGSEAVLQQCAADPAAMSPGIDDAPTQRGNRRIPLLGDSAARDHALVRIFDHELGARQVVEELPKCVRRNDIAQPAHNASERVGTKQGW